MLYLLGCIGCLLLGYFTYGKYVEAAFSPRSSLKTPALRLADGVDFVRLPDRKIYWIQLLNISGLGPIFGPILGALYGPVAMLWIVIGCIFGGIVHDYFSGMLSIRQDGASIPSVVGRYLGTSAKQLMNVFATLLLLLVGVVFVLGPAKMLAELTATSAGLWIGGIFVYYALATLIPIDKIIGRAYPFFGALLVFMSVGLALGHACSAPEAVEIIGPINNHPAELPLWPLLFITIACGAVSGFHATQSPLMARCLNNESSGRFIFMGAMVGEGLIALIWCSLGLTFYESGESLSQVLSQGGPGAFVHEVSFSLLGTAGGIIAIIGVVILPITSGDTAFRSCRLILAEALGLNQRSVKNRLLICGPLFLVGLIISQANFDDVWRYFGWANQTTAAIMLWAASAHLKQAGKNHWICSVPAMFMTVVVITFILNSQDLGLGFSMLSSTALGVSLSVAIACWVFWRAPLHVPSGLVNDH